VGGGGLDKENLKKEKTGRRGDIMEKWKVKG
jgi:hypothetical protein